MERDWVRTDVRDVSCCKHNKQLDCLYDDLMKRGLPCRERHYEGATRLQQPFGSMVHDENSYW